MSGKTVLLLGPPGSGKGTQAAFLQELGFIHISAGNLLRAEVMADSPLGKTIAKTMEEGRLVDDNVTASLIAEEVNHLGLDEHVVIDGFPRTLRQAHLIEFILYVAERKVDSRINFSAPEEVLIERLSSRWICMECQVPYNVLTNPPETEGKCDACGGELMQRTDDTAEAAAVRLNTYNTETQEALAFMETLNRGVITIDSTYPIETINETLGRMFVPKEYEELVGK